MMHMNTVIILIIPIIAIMLINASFIIISKSLHLSTPFFVDLFYMFFAKRSGPPLRSLLTLVRGLQTGVKVYKINESPKNLMLFVLYGLYLLYELFFG